MVSRKKSSRPRCYQSDCMFAKSQVVLALESFYANKSHFTSNVFTHKIFSNNKFSVITVYIIRYKSEPCMRGLVKKQFFSMRITFEVNYKFYTPITSIFVMRIFIISKLSLIYWSANLINIFSIFFLNLFWICVIYHISLFLLRLLCGWQFIFFMYYYARLWGAI